MKNIVSELDNKSYKVLEASDLHQFYEESRGLVPLDLNTYQLVDGSVYAVSYTHLDVYKRQVLCGKDTLDYSEY